MNKRNLKILEMFVKGKTYQFIGDSFGLTKERIRQIINKHLEPYQVKELLKVNRQERKTTSK